jgi:hypothetical protein
MSSELQPNLIALQTIVYREVKRFTRIWPQTLLPPAITMVLYFVIFGNLIGRQIGARSLFGHGVYLQHADWPIMSQRRNAPSARAATRPDRRRSTCRPAGS